MHAKFQLSSFKTVGGDRGDGGSGAHGMPFCREP